jgi:hypothetical protein
VPDPRDRRPGASGDFDRNTLIILGETEREPFCPEAAGVGPAMAFDAIV